MSTDDLEILITQSLDGLLSPEEQAKLDAELARNPAARKLRDEYLALNTAIAQASLPNLNYDRLAAKISDAIEESEPQVEVYVFPTWARWSGAVAAAACLALFIGIWLSRTEPIRPMAESTSQGSTQVAIMNSGEPINSEPLAAVSVGPQPGTERVDLSAREALTAPRSAVAIDAAAPSGQDTDRSIY